MHIETAIDINAPKADVWKVITDIDGSVDRISGINAIEVLERPDKGLVGLKWQETRTMFGKEATEIMWITDATENEMYKTRAESHGAVYMSWLKLDEQGGVTTLTMGFEGKPQTLPAKIIGMLTVPMMKKSTLKALDKDLVDIKAAVEGK
jgi:hypothetical protein